MAGQIIIATGWVVARPLNVVILGHDGLEKVKRIQEIVKGKIFVVGDNLATSTDSRHFGWLTQDVIIATVIWPRRRTIKAVNKE